MDLHSLKDIDKISLELLKGSKSLDVFPTPVDKIVKYSEMLVDTSLDISTVHKSFADQVTDALLKALSKVRGILDRRKNTIYLDMSQIPSRKNFVKLHEVGHGVLPWQKHIHELLEDDDDSLSSHTTEEFEIEANYFASVTLFQHDRFVHELNKLDLGMESAKYLSKHFGASFHATLRKYVESSPKKCALLVLEKIAGFGSFPKCSKRDFFASKKFAQTFGELDLPDTFGYTWNFTQYYYHNKKGILSGLMTLTTENGETDFKFQFFNNSYNAFVFLYPVGEKTSSRITIIIKETN